MFLFCPIFIGETITEKTIVQSFRCFGESNSFFPKKNILNPAVATSDAGTHAQEKISLHSFTMAKCMVGMVKATDRLNSCQNKDFNQTGMNGDQNRSTFFRKNK